ncbi:MAG: hypothetical protein L0387_19715, partial [Acidobacteria bacterium]|nr:hypothetical protein [Acidobacteriota bacterium]
PGVPPAIVAAGPRSGLRPLRGGRVARRDARAPRAAVSNARFVSSQWFRQLVWLRLCTDRAHNNREAVRKTGKNV